MNGQVHAACRATDYVRADKLEGPVASVQPTSDEPYDGMNEALFCGPERTYAKRAAVVLKMEAESVPEIPAGHAERLLRGLGVYVGVRLGH